MNPEIEVAYKNIANIMMNGRKTMKTAYVSKTALGVADVIRLQVRDAIQKMSMEEIKEYFEL